MTITQRPRDTIVHVRRALSADGRALPATVYERGPRRIRQQMLSPEVERALGHDLGGYFEAQDIDGMFWIGERLPKAGRSW